MRTQEFAERAYEMLGDSTRDSLLEERLSFLDALRNELMVPSKEIIGPLAVMWHADNALKLKDKISLETCGADHKHANHGRGEFTRDEDGDGFVKSM